MNIGFISYWMSCTAYIHQNNFSQSEDNAFQTMILILMMVHSIWILNFIFGYNFLRYEYLKGIIFYSIILCLDGLLRISLNIAVLAMYNGNIKNIMVTHFNIYWYIPVIFVQTVLDGILIWKLQFIFKLIRQKLEFIVRKLLVSLQALKGKKEVDDDVSQLSNINTINQL